MALKINKELTTRDGGKIEKGAIVTFQLIILPTADEIHFDLFIYRNEQSVKDRSVGPIYPKEIITFGIIKKIDTKQLVKLTYNDQINILKSELEALPGIGSECIEIIDLESIKLNPVVFDKPIIRIKKEKTVTKTEKTISKNSLKTISITKKTAKKS